MRRRLLVISAVAAALGIASGAHAASLVIDTDRPFALVGETVTITATLDTLFAVGSVANQVVNVEIRWEDAVFDALNPTAVFTQGTSSQIVTLGPSAGESFLTSLGGGLSWIGPPTTGCVLAGPGLGNTCAILNQAILSGPFAPDRAILVGTLQLQVVALGLPGLEMVAEGFSAFGVTPTFGTNFQAFNVPEPATAALLGLGLAGLARARCRRSGRT